MIRIAALVAFTLLTSFALHAQNLLSKVAAGSSFSLDFYTDSFVQRRATPGAGSFQFADLQGTFDLQHFTPLSGTNLFTSVHLNGSYSAESFSTLQGYAGIASPAGLRLAEIWMQHSTAAWMSVKLGKIDANTDFARVDSASNFLNSAFSYDPTFESLPNYYDTRWGGEVLFRRKSVSFNTALFDCANGALLIQEVAWDGTLFSRSGRLALGFWEQISPSSILDSRDANWGLYFVGEQKLWARPRPDHQPQTLSAFVQLGAAPAYASTISRHVAAGLVLNAPLARRDQDSLGFAITSARVNEFATTDITKTRETIAETYYNFQLPRGLSVSPDVQYVLNSPYLPQGSRAVAFGARLSYSISSHRE